MLPRGLRIGASPENDTRAADHGDVTARSPFALQANEELTTYEATLPARLHRPRGRPRRAA